MRIARAVLTGFAAISLSACSVATPEMSWRAATYTCCEADDLRDYSPGETMTLHWILVPGTGPAATVVVDLTLTAVLIGPFSAADELKSGADAGGARYAAPPLQPPGGEDEVVSSIEIPVNATPGYYQLETGVVEPGGAVTGASIVRIIGLDG